MRFENYTKNKETPALCHNRLNFIFLLHAIDK